MMSRTSNTQEAKRNSVAGGRSARWTGHAGLSPPGLADKKGILRFQAWLSEATGIMVDGRGDVE